MNQLETLALKVSTQLGAPSIEKLGRLPLYKWETTNYRYTLFQRNGETIAHQWDKANKHPSMWTLLNAQLQFNNIPK